MVFVRHNSNSRLLVVGPLTEAGVASWEEGAEILWVKFKLGTFMPHMPFRDILDQETALPEATGRSFWLKGSAWQFPDPENIETFIDRLARAEILVRDRFVNAALGGDFLETPSRTVRHRFQQATGLPPGQIRQFERARQAETLLRCGHSISDTVYEMGYFDQPHLTRSLKRWVGYTPAQIARSLQPK
jgi:AraC-like DNA-binding protein